MMKKVQKGFTLIELMIVVAIIGILAAVAIPAYQDYIARAQVSEAVTLLGGAKTPFAEYYADNGQWPPNVTTVVPNVSGSYVSTIAQSSASATSDANTLTATFKGTGVNSDIASTTMRMYTTNGGNTWTCRSGTTNGTPERLIPGACKN